MCYIFMCILKCLFFNFIIDSLDSNQVEFSRDIFLGQREYQIKGISINLLFFNSKFVRSIFFVFYL